MRYTGVVHCLSFLTLFTASAVTRSSRALSCTDGLRRCQKNPGCATKLRETERHCRRRSTDCLECSSGLGILQLTIQFRNCTCQQRPQQRNVCEGLQDLLFRHPCLSDQGWAADIDPTRSVVGGSDTTTLRTSGESDTNVDDEEDSQLDKQNSCIGERKRCMNNLQCRNLYEQIAVYCHTDATDCTTSQNCSRTMSLLRGERPGLFNCTCNLQQSRNKARCIRVQSTVSGTICDTDTTSIMTVTTIASTAVENNHPTTTAVYVDESTCMDALEACRMNPTCNNLLNDFVEACTWNTETVSCNRDRCLQALRRFYLMLSPQFTHSLLFCQCASGDKPCTDVQGLVTPLCAVMEAQTPACHQLINRCKASSDCSTRLGSYEERCAPSASASCLHNAALCRNAHARIMGTILMTNCSCESVDTDEVDRCHRARQRLRSVDTCIDFSRRDFHQQNPRGLQNEGYVSDTTDPEHSGVHTLPYNDCRNRLAHSFPSYYPRPEVVREYRNDSYCAHVCYCVNNGSSVCKVLPCSPPLSCFVQNTDYDHGSLFELDRRGPCRCIKAEVVCAKPEVTIEEGKRGLFVYLGVSISDKNMVEYQTPLTYDVSQVRRKLATLLNGDSAAQFCSVTLNETSVSHIKLQIEVSKYMETTGDAFVGHLDRCLKQAQSLVVIINRRDYSIITDAELSLIKVAKLEGERYIRNMMENPPTVPPSISALSSSDNSAGTCASNKIAETLMVLCVLHLLRN